LRYKGFFYARAGMDVWTNGGRLFLLDTHSNYSSISGPFCFKQIVGFCIDAGGLETISFFNKRNRCYKSGYWVNKAGAKGFDF
jgi:hypothetical protein